MHTCPADPSLREALDRIAKNHGGRNVRAQVAEVERLRMRFRHSITAVEIVDDATSGRGQFTCYMHALDLSVPPPLVVSIMERFDSVFPGAEFIALLVEHQRLEAVPEPENDDVVIYFAGHTPKHAGKFNDGMVVSKWGLGHLWQHPVFEVPESYGQAVQAFRRVDGAMAAEWFVDYATGRVGANIIATLKREDA